MHSTVPATHRSAPSVRYQRGCGFGWDPEQGQPKVAQPATGCGFGAAAALDWRYRVKAWLTTECFCATLPTIRTGRGRGRSSVPCRKIGSARRSVGAGECVGRGATPIIASCMLLQLRVGEGGPAESSELRLWQYGNTYFSLSRIDVRVTQGHFRPWRAEAGRFRFPRRDRTTTERRMKIFIFFFSPAPQPVSLARSDLCERICRRLACCGALIPPENYHFWPLWLAASK